MTTTRSMSMMYSMMMMIFTMQRAVVFLLCTASIILVTQQQGGMVVVQHVATAKVLSFPPSDFRLGKVHINYDSIVTGSDDNDNDDDTTISTFTTNYTIKRQLQQQQDIEYAPIRMAFDTTVLDSLLVISPNDTDLANKIRYIKEVILPKTANKWSQHLHVRPVPSNTPILVGSFVCNEFYDNYFASLTSPIVYSNTDLVIIVGGDNPFNLCGDDTDGTLAYAFPCEIDTTTNRPIYGTFHFCLNKLTLDTSATSNDTTPAYIVGGSKSPLSLLSSSNIPYIYSIYTNTTFYTDNLQISLLDITVHEVGHILGMSYLLYPYTRFDDGTPRTTRSTTDGFTPTPITRMCANGTTIYGISPPDTVVQVSTSMNPISQQYNQYWVTERVKAIAQIHYNCSTILGARLEDTNRIGTPDASTSTESYTPCLGSHWHERTLYSELLSPTVNQGSENKLSYFTLAFMEDTGWYQADYRGAGYPSFGLLAGCGFVDEPCIDSTTEKVSTSVQNEFCTRPLSLDMYGTPSTESLNSIYCDVSYQAWVICDLASIRQLGTNEFTYFPSNPTLSTLFLQRADNCPIPSLSLGLSCLDDTKEYNPFYDGETVGPTSRCLNAYSDSTNGRMYRPACMRIICDTNERVVKIAQGNMEQVCEYDGQELMVSSNRTDSATFICPRRAAVCPTLFTCPDGCFGRGECTYTNLDSNGRVIPTCKCFNETNTHASCAPSSLLNRVPTQSPSTILLPPSLGSPTIDINPFQPTAGVTTQAPITQQAPANIPAPVNVSPSTTISPSREPIVRVRTNTPTNATPTFSTATSSTFNMDILSTSSMVLCIMYTILMFR